MSSWKILAALTTGISMVFIDITVLPVALPTIGRDLHLSPLSLQWIVNAYTLTLTILVLVGGRLGDHFGLKRIFCLGIVLFATSSALCGLGRTSVELIMSRSLQGIGGALMLPAAQGIIAQHFPPHQRGKALGFFVSIGSIFLTSGPLIGGYFTEYYSWHYVFWINLPIAAIGLSLALWLIPIYPTHPQSFDPRGFIIGLLGIGSLVTGIMQAPVWGFSSLLTLGAIIIGIGLLWYLIRFESTHSHPLIPLTLLRIPTIRTSLTTAFIGQCLVMIAFFWSIFFQTILGYSPSQAGMLTFIANTPIFFAAPLAGHCADRWGPSRPIIGGFILVGLSLIGMLFADKAPSTLHLLPTLLCFGMGVPFIFAPNATALLNAAPAERRGTASGLLIATRQFSSTLGIAVFGALYHPWTSMGRFNLIHFVALGVLGLGLFFKLKKR